MGLYLGPCVSLQAKKHLFHISWWNVPKPSRPRSYATSPRSSLYSSQKVYLWTPMSMSSLGPLWLSCDFLPCLHCLALHIVDCPLYPVVFGLWSWTQKPQMSFCWIYQWLTKFLLQMYSHGLEEMIYTLLSFYFFPHYWERSKIEFHWDLSLWASYISQNKNLVARVKEFL